MNQWYFLFFAFSLKILFFIIIFVYVFCIYMFIEGNFEYLKINKSSVWLEFLLPWEGRRGLINKITIFVALSVQTFAFLLTFKIVSSNFCSSAFSFFFNLFLLSVLFLWGKSIKENITFFICINADKLMILSFNNIEKLKIVSIIQIPNTFFLIVFI